MVLGKNLASFIKKPAKYTSKTGQVEIKPFMHKELLYI